MLRRQCDVENTADFCRYYANSWVGWRGSDAAFVLPSLVSPYPDGERIYVRPLSKLPDGEIYLNPQMEVPWKDALQLLDFGVPDVGMTADGPTVVYCSYNSPRQPRKGFRPREMSVTDFNGWAIRNKYALTHASPTGGYPWIWFTFNPEYPTLARAQDLLESGEKIGVALSRTIGVYSSPRHRYSLLAYKRWTVGYILDPSSIFIMPQYEDYAIEISRLTGAKVSIL